MKSDCSWEQMKVIWTPDDPIGQRLFFDGLRRLDSLGSYSHRWAARRKQSATRGIGLEIALCVSKDFYDASFSQNCPTVAFSIGPTFENANP